MCGGFSFLISKVESIPVLHGCCGGSDEMRHVKSTLKLQSNIVCFYGDLTRKGEDQVATRHEPGSGASWVALSLLRKIGKDGTLGSCKRGAVGIVRQSKLCLRVNNVLLF